MRKRSNRTEFCWLPPTSSSYSSYSIVHCRSRLILELPSSVLTVGRRGRRSTKTARHTGRETYNTDMHNRVLSSQSLLGLVGLDAEDSEDFSNSNNDSIENTLVTNGNPAMNEEQDGDDDDNDSDTEQEDLDIELSLSTRTTQQGIDDGTIMTTPPGSIQTQEVSTLSPPLMTTYSSSTTEEVVLQSRHDTLIQESPQIPQPTRMTTNQQPRSRPPRAPQLPSSSARCNNSSGQIIFPRVITPSGPDAGSRTGNGGGHHNRMFSDVTNCSFLSCLTDTSAGGMPDFNHLPRRRTLSLDDTVDIEGGGPDDRTVVSSSLRGTSLPSHILQPILRHDDDEKQHPPMSIWASNLRRTSPLKTTPPIFLTPTRTPQRNASIISSQSPSNENNHPIIMKHRNHFSPLACSSSTHTATTVGTTTPFGQGQDEKEEERDDPYLSPLQTLFERGNASSYSSSPSAPCIRLRKKTVANFHSSSTTITQRNDQCKNYIPNNRVNYKRNSNNKNVCLNDIVISTKESLEETEIIKSLERHSIIENKKLGIGIALLYSLAEKWLYWGLFHLLVLLIGNVRTYSEKESAEIVHTLFCTEFSCFYYLVVAITVIERSVLRKILNDRNFEHYHEELAMLKKKLMLLNDVVTLSMQKSAHLSTGATNGETERKIANNESSQNCTFGSAKRQENHVLHELNYTPENNRYNTLCFQTASEYIHRLIDTNLSAPTEIYTATREDFIGASQVTFEKLICTGREDEDGDIDFQLIAQAAKLSCGSIGYEANIATLSSTFNATLQGRVSRCNFITSIDEIYKTMRLLVGSIDNSSRINAEFESIVNAFVYSLIAVFTPLFFWADTNTIFVTLIALLLNITVVVYLSSSGYLKGILHIIIKQPYNIGDRICFNNTPDPELKLNNLPLGGWIIEKFDLYTTTVRQGITGEHSTFPNSCMLKDNTRVVTWKRSQKANVLFALKFNAYMTQEKGSYLRKRVTEWIEDHPCEWNNLILFRIVDADFELKLVEYNIVIQHTKPWHNFSLVEQSRSDTLMFLLDLQKDMCI